MEFHAWQLIKYNPRYAAGHSIFSQTYIPRLNFVVYCLCYWLFSFLLRRTLHSMSSLLSSRFRCHITRTWVCRMYKRWRWTFKNTSQKHIHKFMWANLVLYGRYLVYIRNIQQGRIKFMDEASFSSRSKSCIMMLMLCGFVFVSSK